MLYISPIGTWTPFNPETVRLMIGKYLYTNKSQSVHLKMLYGRLID